MLNHVSYTMKGELHNMSDLMIAVYVVLFLILAFVLLNVVGVIIARREAKKIVDKIKPLNKR